MLKKWIYDTTIILQDSVESWPQALELCAKPLLDLQVIAPEYVTAIIEQHQTLGPYYVLAPGLAMPHARPEEGAKGLGLSLLKLKQGVSFGAGEFDPVDVIVMLAAPDKHSHIEMISALAELFSSDEDMAELHRAKTLEEIKTVIDRF
ncbi:PTS sugar transporter subunit IIA [Enterobacter hormaechei]|jgi:PTS system ascorbate-specific IIA component|uniref:PTS sugar transporter subunit IIA n=1 Tax=Enterobacter TaxID=547 RepID=UPI0005ED66D9|nr:MULTISPECIES: PTS sugar transporter subunit IIA [Enterobacter]PNY61931.1 PTS ascorbate transporter subunit IIA [Enterobacter cloacae]EKK5500638.1 PTS sugar transporter subunit IIA [Enterobacter hormaechei]EKK5546413.1 PTS sugar transporter subunit IIA [Enterobacter hormaechei]EKS6719187.1 PTS sugar transporter subunit IIA [Enterobacter hormaechei]ELC6357231.1 PTS sugar transporter subunit IIA [Enterobacter hormaechei]